MQHATAIHDSGTLERGVDALLAEAAPRAAPGARAEGGGAAAAELSGAVDELLAGATGPGRGAVPIRTLDAQLAEAADDLIAGEFADEDEILNAVPAVVAPVVPVPASQDAEKPAPEVSPETEEPAAVAKVAEPEPAPMRAPRVVLPPPVEAVAPSVAEEARKLPSPKAAMALALGALFSPVISALDAAAAAVSAPLRNRSQHTRDLVGWLAMVNLFLAVCVWVYLLAIRSPVAPDPEPLPVAAAKGEAGGHGDASEHGGGHGDAHASAKKPAKKDKGKKAKDAHASAEH
jgi:hypothetical protein